MAGERNGWHACLVCNLVDEEFDFIGRQFPYLGAALRGTGIAEETARIMDDTLQGAITRLLAAFDGAFISIGATFAPSLKGF